MPTVKRNVRRMEVIPDGSIACLVITREDGHELSLSSDKGSLVHWNGGECVKDYGAFHREPSEIVTLINEFLAVTA